MQKLYTFHDLSALLKCFCGSPRRAPGGLGPWSMRNRWVSPNFTLPVFSMMTVAQESPLKGRKPVNMPHRKAEKCRDFGSQSIPRERTAFRVLLFSLP